MKIRCEQNSVRLRLRKSELVQLRAEQWLETAVHFPDGQAFSWELTLEEAIQDIGAQFANGRMRIRVPISMAQTWMDSQTVGLEGFIALPEGHSLHILVEKDFPCKGQPEEDKRDFFTELAEEAPVNC